MTETSHDEDFSVLESFTAKRPPVEERLATGNARQTDRDHETLDKARRTGRIKITAREVVR